MKLLELFFLFSYLRRAGKIKRDRVPKKYNLYIIKIYPIYRNVAQCEPLNSSKCNNHGPLYLLPMPYFHGEAQI